MHIREVHVRGFKRFTDAKITDLPAAAKLVVLTGQNGSGKSSLFDAFQLWHGVQGHQGLSMDETYGSKKGPDSTTSNRQWHQNAVNIAFHEQLPADRDSLRKIIYIRSAYRHEPDFTMEQLQRTGSIFDAPRIHKLIDHDTRVSDNYRRLVSSTVEGIYDGQFDSVVVRELREKFIGPIRESMNRVFDDLILRGPGDPLRAGSFYFEKGTSRDFHYKNLSAGEKAAFDILLDVFTKRVEYNDTVFCIDEPEIHMHTRLQGRLLEELFSVIPDNSQLWIASHSIGMLRTARDLKRGNSDEVAFLDLHDQNFDQPVVIRPIEVTRSFWQRMLSVAMDDLANLMAPSQVILCEGRPGMAANDVKAEFDAKCYRTIFAAEFPDSDFISVGNASEVQTDRLQVGRSIQALISGTTVTRLVDRDGRSTTEVQDLQDQGVHVLHRRHLEAYLLDDEILTAYCLAEGQPQHAALIIAAKQKAIADSVSRGNPPDDHKSAAGQLYNEIKRILQLVASGNDAHAFMRDSLAKHVTPLTKVYEELCQDVFGV